MNFEEIYNQWTRAHNERAAIDKSKKRDASDEEKQKSFESINHIRRMSIQDHLDLHGLFLEQAITEVSAFLDSCAARKLRKVRIITGKGLHSPGGVAVLKPDVISVITNHKAVREIDTNPKAKDGGSGAVIVILKGE